MSNEGQDTLTVTSEGAVESVEKAADHYSAHPVPANGKGQIMVKFTVDGVLRDLVPGDTHVEIERVNVSGTTLYCEGKPWRSLFEAHDIEVAKGRTMVMIAKNTHATARAIRVTVAVEPRAVSAAIQAGNNVKVAPVTKRISRNGPQHNQPRKSNKFSKSRANAPELVMVAPNDGEKAVLMIRGHVHALLRFLEHRVPLHPSHLSSLRGELDRAVVQEGTVSIGGNEVAALMSPSALDGLIVSIRAKRNVLNPIETDEVLTSLNQALNRVQTPPKKKFAPTAGLARNIPPRQLNP